MFIHAGRIVDNPIADVIDPLALENIGRVDGFTQARRQPAARTLPGKTRDLVEARADDRRFATLDMVDGFLVHAVTDEFPACIAHRNRGLRIGIDDARIETRGSRQGPRRERLEYAGKSRAHAIIGPGEVRYIRHGFTAMRRSHNGSWHRLVELPVLDVDDEMHQDSFSLERRQRRAGRREQIGNPRICH